MILSFCLMFNLQTQSMAATSTKNTQSQWNGTNVVVENLSTHSTTTLPLQMTPKKISTSAKGSKDLTVTQNYSAIIQIDKSGRVKAAKTSSISSSSGASEENVYWKATIKMTYTFSGNNVNYTKVSGNWT